MHETWRCCSQAERAAQHRAEEVAERARLLEEYAAADRVEQLSQQRARLRVADHRRQVEALLAAKRAAFEQEQVRLAMENRSRKHRCHVHKEEGRPLSRSRCPFTVVIHLIILCVCYIC